MRLNAVTVPKVILGTERPIRLSAAQVGALAQLADYVRIDVGYEEMFLVRRSTLLSLEALGLVMVYGARKTRWATTSSGRRVWAYCRQRVMSTEARDA